jgi:hypothetical protein
LLLESRIFRNQLLEHRSKLNAKAGNAPGASPLAPRRSIPARRWNCRTFQTICRFRDSGA